MRLAFEVVVGHNMLVWTLAADFELIYSFLYGELNVTTYKTHNSMHDSLELEVYIHLMSSMYHGREPKVIFLACSTRRLV